MNFTSVTIIWSRGMFLDTSTQTPDPCELCPSQGHGSQVSQPVHRRHYSSRADRSRGGLFYCLGCKRSHAADVSGRLRVCVSASALHEFWFPRSPSILYRGSPHHVDYLSVPGAPVLDLMAVFKKEYDGVTQPLDVVLVGSFQLVIFFFFDIIRIRLQASMIS